MTSAGFTIRRRTRTGSAVAVSASDGDAGSTIRLLAIAYAVERLVEVGTVASYGDAARQLGISHVRMSNICALLQLSPDIQEALLDRRLTTPERALRPVCQLPSWSEQRDAFGHSQPKDASSVTLSP